MQISKLFSAFCAVAFCVGFITVRADDNPAQAAARAALEETTRNLDTQQVDTAAIELKAKKDAEQNGLSKPTPPPILVTSSNVVVVQPGQLTPVAPTALTSSNSLSQPVPPPSLNNAAAETAVQEKTSDLNAQAEAKANADKAAAEAKAKQAVAEINAKAEAQAQTEAQKQADIAAQIKSEALKSKEAAAQAAADAQAKAQAATEAQAKADAQAKAEAQAQAEAQKETALAAQKSAEAGKAAAPAAGENYPGKELKPEPIEAPPLPISSVKQAQLQDLLAKYKADLIPAGQYQAERTKILADP